MIAPTPDAVTVLRASNLRDGRMFADVQVGPVRLFGIAVEALNGHVRIREPRDWIASKGADYPRFLISDDAWREAVRVRLAVEYERKVDAAGAGVPQ